MPVPISAGTWRTLRLAGWGTLGMAAGFAGGGLLAAAMPCRIGCGGDDPGLDQALIGTMAGAAVLTPLTVHLANGQRGSLAYAYLAATVIAGAGVVGLYEVGNPTDIIFFVGTPLAQVVSAVWIESVTGRSQE